MKSREKHDDEINYNKLNRFWLIKDVGDDNLGFIYFEGLLFYFYFAYIYISRI